MKSCEVVVAKVFLFFQVFLSMKTEVVMINFI